VALDTIADEKTGMVDEQGSTAASDRVQVGQMVREVVLEKIAALMRLVYAGAGRRS
jgi:hypothetical protein